MACKMQKENRKQIHWIALVITKSCECVAQDVRFSQALDINKAPTSDSGSELGLRKPEPWQGEGARHNIAHSEYSDIEPTIKQIKYF